MTKISPCPSNTRALQALNTQSGGSRGNTLTLSKTWCAGTAKLLWLPPTFPSTAEPEQLLQLLQQQTRLVCRLKWRKERESREQLPRRERPPQGWAGVKAAVCQLLFPAVPKGIPCLWPVFELLAGSWSSAKEHLKCWVETYLDTSAFHMLCGWPEKESAGVSDIPGNVGLIQMPTGCSALKQHFPNCGM